MVADNGEKKKRGRKKTKPTEENVEPKPHRKRGRKPKGGKIIQQYVNEVMDEDIQPNIILHLKCSMKDLNKSTTMSNVNYDPNVEHIESYNLDNTSIDVNCYVYDKDEKDQNVKAETEEEEETDSMAQIWKKINQLKLNLHKNDIADKRSACFWCTCDFDNPPIYIPKYEIKKSYHVYGCFCSPECAVSFLMDENIDSAIKFERYHLLNHIYGKIYNYEKNIKPAPSPYYILNKYYGNLTIQEYRKLLRHECLLLVVEKPLTHILPELHEDNDEFLLNNKTIPSNTYKLKRKAVKYNKKNIINNTFGKN